MQRPPSSPLPADGGLGFGRLFFLTLALVVLELSLHGLLLPLLGLHAAALAATAVALIAFPWWLARRLGFSPADFFRLRRPALSQVLWTVVATLASLPVIDRLTEWNLRLLPPPESYQRALAEARPQDPATWVLAALGMVLVGPLGEEMVFRGMLQRSGRRALGPTQALWLVAVLFAAVHLQPYHLAGLLAVGLLLGALFERGGNLALPLLAHALYNAVSLATWSQDPQAASPLDGPVGWALAALGLGVTLWALGRLRPVDPTWWTSRWSDPD